MKKLTKTQLVDKTNFQTRLSIAKEAAELAIIEANDAIAAAVEKAQESINSYNELVNEINTWREDVRSEQQDYISQRSEKWGETENGQAYMEWSEAWDQELDQAPELDAPEVGYGDLDGEEKLDEWPDEP